MESANQFLFVEKYRPKTVEDCILPNRIKDLFKNFVAKGEINNLLLTGAGGCGKTSVSKALCNDLNCDNIIINCSENGNIDTLRTTIRDFASSVSLDGGVKVVILDEADGLNPNSTQPALRNFIEEFVAGCRFIFTANFVNKIIDPLQSRLVPIDFTMHKEEKLEVMMAWDKRVKAILANEGIEYDNGELQEVLIKYFPDFRRTLNMLQRYSQNGKLQPQLIGALNSDDIAVLFSLLKEKNFTELRKWIAENPYNDFNTLSRALWQRIDEYMTPESIPQYLIFMNDYQFKNAFVVDKTINTAAFLTEVMAECRFK